MAKKSLASLNVVISAITSPLFRGLKKASKRIIAFGTKMKAVGRSISMSFALPFAAVGVAGAKMAIDFEQSMTKINTLVGTSVEEVNKLATSVKAMAVETATPAKELADALFFIQSAGIKGAESLKVLEVSAKGASMNMGEITDIASATTSIMTGFGKTSAEAGDLLHETLKQGKFEASEFMNKIGQVIPVAAGLGVSFEELGAATATMSKLSGDAAGSLTAVNSMMMKLKTPGAEQKAILKDLGMGYDDLNAMLQDSLMGTLNHLFSELEGNDEALVRVFGSVRAVKAAFATAGLQADTYADVLDGMNNSMGNVERGFETQSQTVGFKMTQAFEKLKLASMELGSVMMPLFTKIANVATTMAKGFTDLDSGTKKLVVGSGALLAFSGPLLTMAGTLVAVFGAILSPIGLVVVALGAIFKIIYDNWETTKSIFVSFINYWIMLYNEARGFRMLVEGIKGTFLTLSYVVGFFFESAAQMLTNFGKFFKEIFGGIGDLILGVFTLDEDLIVKGFKDLTKGLGKTLETGIEDIDKKYSSKIAKVIDNAGKAIEGKAPLELITESDIQNTVDNVGGWLTGKLETVKNKLKGFFGGPDLLIPGSDDGSSSSSGGGDDTKTFQKTIEKKKSILQKYLEFAKNGYAKFADNVSQVWGRIEAVAGAVLNSIGNLFAAQSNKAMAILDNEETKKNQNLENDFLREEAAIMNSGVSQEKKDARLIQLKEKFDGKQATLDKEMDAKKKTLQKKAAMREKKMQIASAIMATAAAVVQALKAGPFIGPPLAILMGGLGAAQIATIASTPIPLAEGGLAFGPTNAIVGDNPNAKNDPELIAPLSKLKAMLGIQNINVNIDGAIKGEDIFLSNQLAGNTRNRFI
tara:strand:+ start:11335 stop:13941 length:2607 start_codon:yes stop_codon:yes gene_type:complete